MKTPTVEAARRTTVEGAPTVEGTRLLGLYARHRAAAAPAAWRLNTSSVAYLHTGHLARMDLYNHPIAICGDGADGLVSHAQLTHALYAQTQDDELVPTSSSLSRKALQPQLTSASMETLSLQPSCSGVMNLNRGIRPGEITRPTAIMHRLQMKCIDTSGRNTLRLAQPSATSMLPTP